MPFDNSPYAQQFLDRSIATSNTPYTSFGQRTARMNGQQDQGYSALFNRGYQGAQEVNDARRNLIGTINGSEFNRNPYLSEKNPFLQENIDNTTSDLRKNFENTRPMAIGSASTGATFGGARNQNYQLERERVFNDQLGRTVSGMRSGDYENRRGSYENALARQYNATQSAPGFSAVDYRDIDAMTRAGGLRQAQQQSEIDGDLASYEDAREWPFRTLQPFAQAMGMGQSYVAPQPTSTGRDKTSQILGGLGILGNLWNGWNNGGGGGGGGGGNSNGGGGWFNWGK